MIKYDNFKKALGRLKEQNNLYKQEDVEKPHRYTDSAKESLVQRFETCYDCLWKTLQKYLKEELGISEEFGKAPIVFRAAIKNNFLSSRWPWKKYNKARIGTAHDYDASKAQEVIDLVDEFIKDAIELYQKMSKEKLSD
ncbi:MAG: nucleotidyltransferase substrate binding protein [Halobacteriovoraceae bacterium]|nr:nucleotidyltransferase substrate binding protein [Halobacteriovoraceae bacterium]